MNSIKKSLLLLPILLSACSLHSAKPLARYYYLNPNKNLSSIGRTALVELDNNSAFPQAAFDVTEALFQALQKKQVFGLAIIRQSDPTWRSLQLVNTTYTLEQLSAIRKTLKCDAVLKGTITGYEPFPHMIIGLRLELIDLADGQLLWALEQIWDTSDKATQDRIRDYYDRHIFPDSETLQEQLGTISSIKFLKFVAYEIAETMQPKR